MAQPFSQQTGYCFNIQRYSVHDGTGIRTVVFLKGCPLRCQWCSNPESQKFLPELAYNPERCIGCGTCLSHITSGAMSRDGEGGMCFAPEKVDDADPDAAKFCPANALIRYGSKKTAAEVLDIVERDSVFYDRSGGGMTISGGEPLAQPLFCRALLEEARERCIQVAMESCGYADLADCLDFLGLLHELFFDIKLLNTEKHKYFTGKDNKPILENIKTIYAAYPGLPITVRTPVIPGVNDTRDDISAIAHFVHEELPGVRYELLRFHRFGAPKYRNLKRPFLLGDAELPVAYFQELQAAARDSMRS